MPEVKVLAANLELARTIERMFDVTLVADVKALNTGTLPSGVNKNSVVIISDAQADPDKLGVLVHQAQGAKAKVIVVEHSSGRDLPRGCFADATLPSGESFTYARQILQALKQR